MEPEGLRSDANIDLCQCVLYTHREVDIGRGVLATHKLLQHETSCIQLASEPNYLTQSAAAGASAEK